MKVILEAMNQGLQTGGLTMFGGPESQAGEKLQWYEPSQEEIFVYWENIIEFLINLLKENSPYKEEAKKILIDKFPTQFRNGAREKMMEGIRFIIEEEGEVNLNLKQQIAYLTGLSEEDSSELEKLIAKYQPTNIESELKEYIKLPPYEMRKEGNIYVNIPEKRAIELADRLCQTQDDSFIEHLPILLSGEQRQSLNFGFRLGQCWKEKDRLVQLILFHLKEVPYDDHNISLLAGLLTGMKDEEKIIACIDQLLAEPKLEDHALRLTRYLSIGLNDLEKLKNLFLSNKGFIDFLRQYNLKHLTVKELKEFLDWLITIPLPDDGVSIDIIADFAKEGKSTWAELHPIAKAHISQFDLKGEMPWDTITLDNYKNLAYDILSENNDPEFARDVLINILESNKIDVSYLQSLFKYLLSDYWDVSWPIVVQFFHKEDYLLKSKLRESLRNLRKWDEGKLWSWLQHRGVKDAEIVAQFVPFETQDKQGNYVLTEIMQNILNEFGDSEEVRMALSRRLKRISSVGGSAIPMIRRRLTLVSTLKDHPLEKVRAFAGNHIDYFEKKIKDEENFDQNLDLGRV
ncbi:MAG: hypothetical protein AAF587_35105 [Bacteroidota bacterium]